MQKNSSAAIGILLIAHTAIPALGQGSRVVYTSVASTQYSHNHPLAGGGTTLGNATFLAPRLPSINSQGDVAFTAAYNSVTSGWIWEAQTDTYSPIFTHGTAINWSEPGITATAKVGNSSTTQHEKSPILLSDNGSVLFPIEVELSNTTSGFTPTVFYASAPGSSSIINITGPNGAPGSPSPCGLWPALYELGSIKYDYAMTRRGDILARAVDSASSGASDIIVARYIDPNGNIAWDCNTFDDPSGMIDREVYEGYYMAMSDNGLPLTDPSSEMVVATSLVGPNETVGIVDFPSGSPDPTTFFPVNTSLSDDASIETDSSGRILVIRQDSGQAFLRSTPTSGWITIEAGDSVAGSDPAYADPAAPIITGITSGCIISRGDIALLATIADDATGTNERAAWLIRRPYDASCGTACQYPIDHFHVAIDQNQTVLGASGTFVIDAQMDSNGNLYYVRHSDSLFQRNKFFCYTADGNHFDLMPSGNGFPIYHETSGVLPATISSIDGLTATVYTDGGPYMPPPSTIREEVSSVESGTRRRVNDNFEFTLALIGTGGRTHLVRGEWFECEYDLDRDGILALADLLIFAQALENSEPLADFAEPYGVIDGRDQTAYLTGFQTTGCN